MTTKETAISTIEQLPDNATWEDIQEHIAFMAGIKKAIDQVEEGLGIEHKAMKAEFASWIGQ